MFFAPIQTILGGTTTNHYYMCFLCFFLKCLFYYCTTLPMHNLLYDIVPCKQGNNGVAPSSKSCQNMMTTQAALAKKYRRIDGVSAHHFKATARKEHKYSLKKHTLSPRARRSVA